MHDLIRDRNSLFYDTEIINVIGNLVNNNNNNNLQIMVKLQTLVKDC